MFIIIICCYYYYMLLLFFLLLLYVIIIIVMVIFIKLLPHFFYILYNMLLLGFIRIRMIQNPIAPAVRPGGGRPGLALCGRLPGLAVHCHGRAVPGGAADGLLVEKLSHEFDWWWGFVYGIWIYIPHDCSFTECHSFGVTKCPLQLPSHKRKQLKKKYIFILGILLYGQAFYKKSAIMYGW